MSKIKLLEKHTIDKIAAGEVVESPRSVVKELVENAIDALSTAITIEIREGGHEFIRITDNGSGIMEDDLQLAFHRHATSKLTIIEDLNSIHSLGFRGEALSSIAAVSKVEVITRHENSPMGIQYKIEGGKEIAYQKIGAPKGTTFIIKDLFYNVPARKKFARKANTEKNLCIALVERLSMSHPEISFKLIVDGKIKVHTSGNHKLFDVLYSIYGRDITSSLLEVQYEHYHYKVSGYISDTTYMRKSRQYQTLFVNERYIEDKKLVSAIESVYEPYLMQHSFPFFVLSIEMEPELVDINVHPAKKEVRFVEEDILIEVLKVSIHQALSQREPIPSIQLEEKPIQPLSKGIETYDFIQPPTLKVEDKKENVPKLQSPLPEPFEVKRFEQLKEDFQGGMTPPKEVSQLNLKTQNFLEEEQIINYDYLGQLFDTYWLIQVENQLYIIDQHAAHEKVIYETLKNKLFKENILSQSLLPTLRLTLNEGEKEVAIQFQDFFHKIGFEFEMITERMIELKSLPIHLHGLESKEGFLEILSQLEENKEIRVEKNLQDKIAMASCKAAIKGNHKLSTLEAKALIKELLHLENPYRCPHGRPTIVQISKYEIEKMFKRII